MCSIGGGFFFFFFFFGNRKKLGNIISGVSYHVNFPTARNIIQDVYMLESLRKEVAVMREISGPNVVQFLNLYESVNNIYIIQEFCNEGDLRSYLTKNGPLKEGVASRFLLDIVKGLYTLVSRNIIHRDLKPENILINEGVLKLADFGFSRPVSDMKSKVNLNLSN